MRIVVANMKNFRHRTAREKILKMVWHSTAHSEQKQKINVIFLFMAISFHWLCAMRVAVPTDGTTKVQNINPWKSIKWLFYSDTSSLLMKRNSDSHSAWFFSIQTIIKAHLISIIISRSIFCTTSSLHGWWWCRGMAGHNSSSCRSALPTYPNELKCR